MKKLLANKETTARILLAAYKEGVDGVGVSLYKKLRLKESTYTYYLEKLKKEKFYTRTRYEVNLEALGLGEFAWLLFAAERDKLDESFFTKKVLSLPQVHTVANVTGNHDYAVRIFGPSMQSISSTALAIERLFEGVIFDTKMFFENTQYKRHYIQTKPYPKVKLKKIDCLILAEKTLNPQISLGEIAKKHKAHRNTVSNRWNYLLNNNVIFKETLLLTQEGYDFIDLGLKAFVVAKTFPGQEDKAIKCLLYMDEIQDLFTTLSNEIIMILRTKNSASLSLFHSTLGKRCKYIKRTMTMILLSKQTKQVLEVEDLAKIICMNCSA